MFPRSLLTAAVSAEYRKKKLEDNGHEKKLRNKTSEDRPWKNKGNPHSGKWCFCLHRRWWVGQQELWRMFLYSIFVMDYDWHECV